MRVINGTPAIRRASTGSANHFTFNMDGSCNANQNRRTLILLDEVDHISGNYRQVNEQRIQATLSSRIEDDEVKEKLKGDSGGKAELLKLLSRTKQPATDL